jgi:hypothetical protein
MRVRREGSRRLTRSQPPAVAGVEERNNKGSAKGQAGSAARVLSYLVAP